MTAPYLPILKGRAGEFLAIAQLAEALVPQILPVFGVTPSDAGPIKDADKFGRKIVESVPRGQTSMVGERLCGWTARWQTPTMKRPKRGCAGYGSTRTSKSSGACWYWTLAASAPSTRCVSEKVVGKHINAIFTKLDLPPSNADDHRRVRAVLAYLRGGIET